MEQSGFPLLTFLILIPVVGIIPILFMQASGKTVVKVWAFTVALSEFLFSLGLYTGFKPGVDGMQFVEKHTWIPSLGVSYHIGVDGISILLVLLTTFLMMIAILASWNAIQERVREYAILMLLLEIGMVGTFVAFDLFLFYIFWEATLIPMYFLVGVWGGTRRIYAAIKFLLFTMTGSVLMLVAILVLYFTHGSASGEYTFNLFELLGTQLSGSVALLLFLAFAVAFAVKVPMFPFHTWLPDAHVEAPTAGSVILAGVLLKMGVYGFLRFCLPLFPQVSERAAPVISALALVGIIYGALMSMVQKDIKSLVAYSSVSHLGAVMLGIFALNLAGMQGGILQMVNHGLSTGALFLVVGMIYERRHTRMISDFGGLAKQMPILSAFFLIITLSSIGFPGLNGFVGEFLILWGAFQSKAIYGILGTTTIILSSIYMLWMFRRVMHGELKPQNSRLKDLSVREVVVLVPIIIMMLWIGIYPKPFLSRTEATAQRLLSQVVQTQEATVGKVSR